MTTLHEQLATTLKLASQSVTTARSCVFAALQNQGPQTMQQLVSRCPSIDRASVYRTIALFEQLGIVQRLQTGWKYKLELSGAFHEHHHHASCLVCGVTIDLPENTALEHELHKLAATYNFHVERHQLELQGICQNCAAA